ncbi:alpha-1,3-glucosyltransferase [Sporothrix schenckii 1099-18]|uniref:Alpha-1,3-glucosyltransferase n=1 Tax=Sporothrix schenckii 1099-18 TaxID=1397361 RepID=A0A0F2MEK9_SPOSC|nr:alpha-1,3-glucosyltransferase [Sporothrix schenckii 1099-18]KJR87295.1 alpha-1,3-glucosyltransferase [Sporothrix schenckii 1099-18]
MAGPSPSPHKPRRKPKKTGVLADLDANSGTSSNGNGGSVAEGLIRSPAYPLAAFLWPARGSVSQWELLPLILMVVGLFRWAAGLWGYSGFNKPPQFGDYEAQRHWMEITTALPVSQWYFHDLDWWGLDYPPLTAYHSWLLGKVGGLMDASWFALHTSRGLETPALKIFMRATVFVSEYLVYIPAVVIFVRRFSRLSGVASWTASVALVAVLLQPSTILIDHVHFQYNTVMLGLVTASMSSMLAGRLLWAAVFFVAALGFKQMALYYALPVFAFLLGTCVFPRINVGRLLGVAAVTVVAFALLLLPLVAGTIYDQRRGIRAHAGLPANAVVPLPLFADVLETYLDPKAFYYPVVEQLVQMVHRVFPVARGLFEDKVANFWCAANVVIKLRAYPDALLQRAALVATLASILPPNLILFLRPSRLLLPYAFAATAWGFFLFSYQVHEKSVLLPLLPTTLLLAGHGGLSGSTRAWVGFANLLGAWTMFPLLKRVDLAVPYGVLTLLWAYLLGLPPTTVSAYFPGAETSYHSSSNNNNNSIASSQSSSAKTDSSANLWGAALIHGPFYLAMVMWHVLEATLAPPADKPDLWVVANVGVGAAGFGICYLWCLWRLLVDSELLPRSWFKTDKKVKKQ